MAVLAEFRRTAEEMREQHASSPGAGAGNSQLLAIDTAHPDLIISAIPRHALTFLSVIFRCMGIYGLSQIGRGRYSEVYSCKGLDGQPIQLSRISVCADTQPRRHAAVRLRRHAAAQTRSPAAVRPRRHAAAQTRRRATAQTRSRATAQTRSHATAQTQPHSRATA